MEPKILKEIFSPRKRERAIKANIDFFEGRISRQVANMAIMHHISGYLKSREVAK